MKIGEVKIGTEYVTKYGRDRVRADAIEKVDRWGREVREVRITTLDKETGEEEEIQPSKPHMTARDLTGEWEPFARKVAEAREAARHWTEVSGRLIGALDRAIGKDAYSIYRASHRHNNGWAINIRTDKDVDRLIAALGEEASDG